MNSLSTYHNKRNFNLTSEPLGQEKKKNKSEPIFVVQFHRASRDHFDFRLEWKGVLLSWAVPKGPSFNPSDKRLAIQVEDHPLDYAEFEGNIPKGQYGGGTVMLFDYGTWSPDKNFSSGLKEGVLKFTLYGERLSGRWTLIRLKDEENSNNWLLIKEKDEKAKKTSGISSFRTSVRTGRTLTEIAKEKARGAKNPFKRTDVQLAKLLTEIPQDESWLYEIKFDGYRIISYIESGRAKLLTRNGIDYTEKLNSLAAILQQFFNDRPVVLDGEVVCLDENGRSDFQALQNALKHSRKSLLSYAVFDVLALDGVDLREEPLLKRKEILTDLLRNAPRELILSRFEIGNGQKIYDAAKKLKLEGIIGKKIGSPYKGGRNGDWIKLKCRRRQEFVIGGYIESTARESRIKALLLGYYDKGNLIYAGLTGTGFSGAMGQSLMKNFTKLERKKSPFSEPDTIKETVHYLKPTLIAEVEFAEWTREGHLRQASFKGIREDKSAQEVVKEESGKKYLAKSDKNQTIFEGITITNPDRLIYKKDSVTKMDVIRYYAEMSGRMLPYLKDRLLSVVRCHRGVTSSCFYKKHPDFAHGGIGKKKVKGKDGEYSEYFYIKDKSGLIGEAQLGSLEFHLWGSVVPDIERPDMMVFDLDPDVEISLKQVRQGVKDLKKVLDDLGLISFLKTSGGKGYHIVVPFEAVHDWAAFHDFARDVAIYMEQKWPDRYTSNVRKNRRKGRIFIDWIRNGKGATSIAPYSLRSRPGAKVSMPISWRELDRVAPDGIDMKEALKRLKKVDPWKDYFAIKQKLTSTD